MAAKKFKLDQIVRVTGDAILCDEVMISKAIHSQLMHNSDVTFIKNMPYGTAKEVMNFKTIKTISEQSKVNGNTENDLDCLNIISPFPVFLRVGT